MIRTTFAALLGALATGLVAWQLSGLDAGAVKAGGVIAGYLLGAGMAWLGIMYQRHALMYRPKAAFAAHGVAMLAKLVVLLMGALSFRYIDAAAARADWRMFVLAFAAATVLLLASGAMDLAATMRSLSTEKKATNNQSAIDPITASERRPLGQAPCGSS